MIFKDRDEAGAKLAEKLGKYKGQDVVVFALPRGGVVIGDKIAEYLMAPLDLVIVKKIGHSANREYAIGAVAEDGDPVCSASEVGALGREWLEDEVRRARLEIRRRREEYMGGRPPRAIRGKIAIIADDGIATGLTMMAAIADIRRRGAAKAVAAIPVAPYETAKELGRMADEVAAVVVDPAFMGAVGAYYRSFEQLDDSDVKAVLERAKKRESR